MSRTSPLPDDPARERIRRSLDETLIVEGPAGSGKTTELLHRVAELILRRGARADEIVVITLREELAGRAEFLLQAELERDGAPSTGRVHLGPIGSFAERILRDHALEAGLDADFVVLAPDERDVLFTQAFEDWFRATRNSPPEGVRRFLRRRSRGFDTTGPSDRLRDAARTLAIRRDFPHPWARPSFDRPGEMGRLVDDLRSLGNLAAVAHTPEDPLAKNLLELRHFSEELDRLEHDRARDHDGLEASLAELLRQRSWRHRGNGRSYGHGHARNKVIARRNALRDELERFIGTCDADLASLLQAELQPVVRHYETLKQKAGALDELDVLIRTRALLRSRPEVRRALTTRFKHLLIDGFEDLDRLQTEIILLLCADDVDATAGLLTRPAAGKLFLSGDLNQAISRNERTDASFPRALRDHLVACGATLLKLTTNHRFDARLSQAIHALRGTREQPASTRAAHGTQPALIALPVPAPFAEWGAVTQGAINASYPDAVGAFVAWLVKESGWTVDSPNGRIPIKPRHVALLFQRTHASGRDVVAPYLEALEARAIPYASVLGRSVHAREEMLALRTALAAIERPLDELSVYATLRGPFFALTDEALLAYRSPGRLLVSDETLDRSTLSELTRPVAEALSVLCTLHEGRNGRPISETIGQLFEATRALSGVALWSTGLQAVRNLSSVMALARRFEAQGGTSFRAFIERLEDEATSPEPLRPISTEAGVRVMRVHDTKGLEFPIVILCDPTADAHPRAPSRFVDDRVGLWLSPLAECVPLELAARRDEVLQGDEAESRRLAEVAATRARELLVVPVQGEERLNGWLESLHDIVYPRSFARRASTPAPGCPPFGEDSVAQRPASRSEARDAVKPGEHVPERGVHPVVWWDPTLLRSATHAPFGLRRPSLLTSDGEAAAPNGWPAWRQKRDATLERASKPSVVLRTGANHPKPVRRERCGEGSAQNVRTLVLDALDALPLDADEETVARAVFVRGRLRGADEALRAQATQALIGLLSHPVFVAARQSADLRRPCPLVVHGADGSFVQSTAALAFETTEGWTVVGFDSDERLQLQAEALEEATGRPVTPVAFEL